MSKTVSIPIVIKCHEILMHQFYGNLPTNKNGVWKPFCIKHT